MFRIIALCLSIVLALAPVEAFASQANAYLPTTGTYSGLTAANTINSAFDALLTCNKGSVAPTNALGAVAKAGQCWLDDSNASFLVKKRYSGSGWVVEGTIDVSSTFWVPPLGGGGVGTISSASTADIGGQPQSFLNVTGTTTITSFGSTMPTGAKVLTFAGILTLTHNATSLILPGALNITTAVGDSLMAVPLGSGNWRVANYTRADGSAVKTDPQLVGAVIMGDFGTVPAKYVKGTGQALSRASFPDYFAAVSRVQSGTFISGNATITSVADTSDLGVGMPVEGTLVNAACTIASITSNTVVMSSSGCAIGSGSANFTVVLPGYGSGGSSTTVGVKNCSGRTMAGTDPAGSILSSATAANTALGGETASPSFTIVTANLPAYTPVGSLTNAGSMTVGIGVNAAGIQVGGGSTIQVAGQGAATFTTFGAGTLQNPVYSINPGSLSWAGNAQGGTSTPISLSISRIQPTVTARCLVRVFASNEPANDNVPAMPSEPMAFDIRRVG